MHHEVVILEDDKRLAADLIPVLEKFFWKSTFCCVEVIAPNPKQLHILL